MGQQLHGRQGQVFSYAATQPQGDVSDSLPGPGAGSAAGRPGAHLQEPQKCGRAEGLCIHTSPLSLQPALNSLPHGDLIHQQLHELICFATVYICISFAQKSCCTVLTEELSLRLRTNNPNKPQENVDKDKEKA